jgi:hypothetical protein
MRPFLLQASHPHAPEQPIHLNSPRTTQLLPNLKPCTWNRLHMALAPLLLLKRISQAFHSSLLLLRLPQFLRIPPESNLLPPSTTYLSNSSHQRSSITAYIHVTSGSTNCNAFGRFAIGEKSIQIVWNWSINNPPTHASEKEWIPGQNRDRSSN